MFLKFQLLCLTLLAVTGNKLEIVERTVFIYYDAVIGEFDLPDCLGTLITANYALTGASCFTKDTYEISDVDFWDSFVFRVIAFIRSL